MNFPAAASPLFPVGQEGGALTEGGIGTAALEPSAWFVKYCEICDAEQVFVTGGLGLVACCLGCGDAPLTRVSSEVA